MKEHEKLAAFVLLLVAIIGLVYLGSTFDRGAANDIVVQGKLRLIDSSVTGLLAVLGMAAQALFRVANTVTIDNKKNDPVPTTDLGVKQEPVAGAPAEELPDYAR